MKIEQRIWISGESELQHGKGELEGAEAQLVLVFGAPEQLRAKAFQDAVARKYPQAHLMGCSTSGEICGTRVLDDSVVTTAVAFTDTVIKGGSVHIECAEDSHRAGVELAKKLDPAGLKHVFVLSDGLHINGTDLVAGLSETLPAGIGITGGLAGDADRFRETTVVWDGPATTKSVAILGLYSEKLKVSCASLGGWDPFGPERFITKSKGNVLCELDGLPALDLYEKYLGEHAKDLPGAGLLFPLSLRLSETGTGVVRTILSVDRDARTLTFAGDVPEGSYARLMKANFDRLIDGATGAARVVNENLADGSTELAILISCVGRKLILKQRIEEEVEGVRDILGLNAVLAGYYSYGEISPFTPQAKCELHNQTMTITAFSEPSE
jgi:hypothetical protein